MNFSDFSDKQGAHLLRGFSKMFGARKVCLCFMMMTLMEWSFATILTNWTKLASGPWSKREGLMGVSYNGYLFMSGGREVGLSFMFTVLLSQHFPLFDTDVWCWF